ncbi:hypothetical protein HGB07_01420 [Candidatus Roizmanbacteria bacterium]|nr:hypothetical protein [Candidatus Roizmanbacteria bacterium]
MSPDELTRLKMLSTKTLESLVTPDGIYASSALGMEGLYHGYFGRDTAITAYLIAQAERIEDHQTFLINAVNGLVRLMEWQSTADNPQTGEEAGKFPHEIRLHEADYHHLTIDNITHGAKSWYVDPSDQVMKNWDSNDSTQLWIIVVARLSEKGLITLDDRMKTALKKGLLWCLRNITEYDGLAGYRYHPERKWAGLINQSWKDSEGAYLYENGIAPAHPIKDIFVNALSWSALSYGARIFSEEDPELASLLTSQAATLKVRFNSSANGFLMYDLKSDYYFAEALDEDNHQLQGVSCDAGLALWAYCGDKSIIDDQYIPAVVKRLMMSDMLDEEAGIRTYSCECSVFDPIGYHRGPHTYWPFVTGLIADGFNQFGYKNEAKTVLSAMVQGIKKFDTCVELFVKKDEVYSRFRHPSTEQVSCTDQAWTAGALYYAANYLTLAAAEAI